VAVRRSFESQLAAVATGPDVRLVEGRAREVMAASDAVLVASGTATLETMLVGRPMVAAYRFAPLTYWLARSLNLVKVQHFSLPNLLAGESLVPEFLQADATPEHLADAIAGILRSPDRQAALRARFAEIHRILRCGASDRAARATLETAGLG
jgi:lipid-A-disaccharide synthase